MRVLLYNFRRALALSMLVTLVLTGQVGHAQDDSVEPITQQEFQARVRFVRWQYLQQLSTIYDMTGGSVGIVKDRALALLESLDDPQTLGASVLDQMEQERLLW